MKYFIATSDYDKKQGIGLTKDFFTCESCLNKHHSHLALDWFVKLVETSEKKCESFGHKKLKKELLDE